MQPAVGKPQGAEAQGQVRFLGKMIAKQESPHSRCRKPPRQLTAADEKESGRMLDIPGDMSSLVFLTPNGTLFSDIDFLGDVDGVWATLEAGLTYGFTATGLNGSLIPEIDIKNSSGTLLTSGIYGPSNTTYLNFTPAADAISRYDKPCARSASSRRSLSDS